MSWKETSLDKCIEFSNGYAFKSKFFTENKNDIPLIKGENLGKGEVLWEKSKYWKVDSLKGLERFLLNAGDIILAMDRPYVGGSLKYAMIKTSDPKALQVQRIGRLVAKQDVINEKFLRCVISSDNFKNYVKNIQGGVGVPHISPSQIKNYEFEIPSIQTQKRIADILSAYDDLIENNLKRIRLLEQAAQNIYKEWFVHLRFPGYENTPINEDTGLPVGWEEKTITDVMEHKVDNRGKNPKYYTKKGIPVIDNHLIKNSPYLDMSNTKRYIDDDLFENFIRRYLKEGDVLITLVGTVGNVSIAPKEKSVIIQNTIGIRCNEICTQEYMYCFLESNNRAIQNKNRGAAQPSVKVGDLLGMTILIPNSNLLNNFSKEIKTMFTMIQTLGKQSQKLKAARDILLPRLMNRTIEV